jgi:hypothetical protein
MDDIEELPEIILVDIAEEVREAVILASMGRTARFLALNRVAYLEMLGGVTPLQMAYRRALEEARNGQTTDSGAG